MKPFLYIFIPLVCLSLIGCSLKPYSPEKTINFFSAHQNEFFSLQKTLESLSLNSFVRIREAWTDPENLAPDNLSYQTLEKIRNDMNELKVLGVDISKKQIFYITHTQGLGITGKMSGFLYSIEVPQNYAEEEINWPTTPFQSYQLVEYPKEGSYSFHVSLGNNWYYFEEYDD